MIGQQATDAVQKPSRLRSAAALPTIAADQRNARPFPHTEYRCLLPSRELAGAESRRCEPREIRISCER